MSRLPVLWLCGAPGTGKSTVAWRVLLDFEREGVRAGYVDIDQLGMVYPPPDGDPDRADLKATNLEAVIAHYARAGAQVLVVSGIIEPEQVRHFAEARDDFEVTFCQLIVEEPVLRSRLTARGWSTADGDEAVEEMRILRQSDVISTTLDTTAEAAGELAARVRSLITPVPPASAQPLVEVAGPRGEVTVVCGPRAVGKSSVSWAMFTRCTAMGRRTCYVDLDQISSLRGGGVNDADRRTLRNANLAAVWRTAAARGATALIANGTVTDDHDIAELRAAVHPSGVHVIRLSAGPAAIEDRIQNRHGGFSARLAGDDLDGASPAHQHSVLEQAVEQERRFSSARLPDLVVDTTSMSLDSVVDHALTARGPGVARVNPG